MYLNYFADSGTFWNIIRLLQNTCSYLQVPSGLCYNVWVTCLTLSPHWRDRVPLLWVSPCQRHDVTHWAWCSNETVKYIQAVTSFNWEMYLQRWERNFSWTESTTIDFMGYWWFLTIQSMSPEQIHAQDCRIDFRILWRIVILFVQISIPAQYKWNKT